LLLCGCSQESRTTRAQPMRRWRRFFKKKLNL
jgi:hypothetical protein